MGIRLFQENGSLSIFLLFQNLTQQSQIQIENTRSISNIVLIFTFFNLYKSIMLMDYSFYSNTQFPLYFFKKSFIHKNINEQ